MSSDSSLPPSYSSIFEQIQNENKLGKSRKNLILGLVFLISLLIVSVSGQFWVYIILIPCTVTFLSNLLIKWLS